MEKNISGKRPQKVSHKVLMDAAVKVINHARYCGPVIFFDVRQNTLAKHNVPVTIEKELIPFISGYICNHQQMNSFILADDEMFFYSNRDICRILAGQVADEKWAAVMENAQLIPCMDAETERKGHQAAWAISEQGWFFTQLHLKNMPSAFNSNGRIIEGVECYLPEVVYWVMETLIRKEMHYPPLHQGKAPWNKLEAKKVSLADKQMLWHRLLKL